MRQHNIWCAFCFDLIQIIFREIVYSLLKILILKFAKNVKSQCGDAAA